LDYAVSLVGERLIDEQGIVAAVKIGIRRCLKRLGCPAAKCLVLLDGSLRAPRQYKNQKTIIRGDEQVPLIALASIAAKVWRDRRMIRLAKRYPRCGFEKHKGYGTQAHYRALKKFGPTPLHRLSFLRRWSGELTKNT
jgi:ribonuclease HII